MGVNLVVTREMLARPIRSETTAVNSRRSRIELAPEDYDGATYYFEIVNGNATTVSYNVTLYDVTNGVTKATIATGTSIYSYKRQRSSSFTPASGHNEYELRIDATTATSDVAIFSARIIIAQVNATKTYISYPLINSYSSATQTDNTGYIDGSTTQLSYGQPTPGRYGLFLKEESKYAAIPDSPNPWEFDVVYSTTSAGNTVKAALFNKTDDTMISTSELTHTGDSLITREKLLLHNSTAGFHDGDEFEVRFMGVNSGQQVNLYKASLGLHLTSLTKAMVYTRLAGYYSGTSGSMWPHQRILYDADEWQAGTTFVHEAVGSDASATPVANAYIRYSATSDEDLGSGYLGGTLTFGATKSRQRSAAISLTDGYRYFGRNASSTGTVSTEAQFLIAIVDAATVDAPTVTTSSITDITATTATGGGEITDEGGSPVTAYGVCWNTIGTPTIADDHTDDS